MEKKFENLVIFAILLINIRYVSTEALVQSRDPNLCYECDSRFEPYCEDTFNITENRVRIVPCNGRCAKVKHWYEDKFFFKRACINSIKKDIYIRYTIDVCYYDDENGKFCLCDDHFCNNANRFLVVFLASNSFLVLNWVKLISLFFILNFCLESLIF